jgi:hypothetical protein
MVKTRGIKTRSKTITHHRATQFDIDVEEFLITIDKNRIWKGYPKIGTTMVIEEGWERLIFYHFHCIYDEDVEEVDEVEEVVDVLEGGESVIQRDFTIVEKVEAEDPNYTN